jgi:O-antigen/teichoic acid export membrane protein
VLHGQAASGISASLVSQFAAVVLAGWCTRELWRAGGGEFRWRPWLARVVPLTLGMGAVMFISSVDTLFVQSQFDPKLTRLYGAGVIVGFGLSQFTLPIASVMFPKIAGGTGADAALRHTLLGTAALGGAVAAVCSLMPTLPLRVVYFRNPEEFLPAAPLVPWFAWSILCLVLANVLVQNLLARQRFAIVPWLAIIAVSFAGGLWWVQPQLAGLETMAAFQAVARVLCVACVALLGTAVWFTWGRTETPTAVPAV